MKSNIPRSLAMPKGKLNVQELEDSMLPKPSVSPRRAQDQGISLALPKGKLSEEDMGDPNYDKN